MDSLYWILVLVAVAAEGAFFLAWKAAKDVPTERAWPYKLRGYVLTENERFVFERLCEAMPQHRVLTQVELSRVLSVSLKGKDRLPWFNRINGKSLDFVICDSTMRIVAAVELDDSTHDNTAQRKRDEVKDRACAASGLRLVRWRRKTLPAAAGIRAAVLGVELSEVEARRARPVEVAQGGASGVASRSGLGPSLSVVE